MLQGLGVGVTQPITYVSTQFNICCFQCCLKDEIQAYGIDIHGPLPIDHGDDVNVVDVPNTLNPLEQSHYQEMCAAIDPLRPSDCHGIDIYMEVLSFIMAHVAI